MRRRIPAIPGHLTRRVLAVLAASASAAALLAAAPPGPVFADHVDTNSRPGHTWQVGTSSHTTWKNGYHTNNWVCRPGQGARWCQNSLIAPDDGQGLFDTTANGRASAGHTGKSSCPLNRPPVDNDAGCGHGNRGGWEFTGHSSMPNPGTPDIYLCNFPDDTDHPNHGSYVDDLHTECSGWVALPECPTGHRHGSGECVPDHEPEPACPTDNTAPVTLSWTEHDSAGNDTTKQKTCPVPDCPAGQHRHGSGDCEPNHQDRVCDEPVTVAVTLTWTGHDADGNDVTKTLDCEPPVCEAGQILQNGVCVDCPAGQSPNADGSACEPDPVPPAPVCGSGEHNHLAAVPGGHQGCRTAHAAPSCTWNSAGTWSPGHGGSAEGGHTTTTGMRVCVSARQFCIDNGADNALQETVGRQNPLYWTDGRGRLPDGYHRDRIPYGRNLTHPQFLPRLTLG